MSTVCDTNHDTTHKLDALKAAGIKTVIRYDNRLNPHGEKQIKPAEAKAIAAAGLRLGIVYEGAGDHSGQFSDAIGYEDAKYAREQAALRGQPDGSAEFFAVDFDANPLQIRLNVIPYFQGIRRAFAEANALPKLRAGVYGSGLSCRSMLDEGLAELAWVSESTGWTESHVFIASRKWNLRQHHPQNIAGLDTDPNDINPDHPDIGDFVPFGMAPDAAGEPQETPSPAPPPVASPPSPASPTPVPAAPWVNKSVTMTEFGGPGDEQDSAYGGQVDPTRPGVALPFHFPGTRPFVRVVHAGKSVDCPIVDVGPHHVNDPYWTTHDRPRAEGEPSNHAGIDATPAVFDMLMIQGPPGTRTAVIDWTLLA